MLNKSFSTQDDNRDVNIDVQLKLVERLLMILQDALQSTFIFRIQVTVKLSHLLRDSSSFSFGRL